MSRSRRRTPSINSLQWQGNGESYFRSSPAWSRDFEHFGMVLSERKNCCFVIRYSIYNQEQSQPFTKLIAVTILIYLRIQHYHHLKLKWCQRMRSHGAFVFKTIPRQFKWRILIIVYRFNFDNWYLHSKEPVLDYSWPTCKLPKFQYLTQHGFDSKRLCKQICSRHRLWYARCKNLIILNLQKWTPHCRQQCPFSIEQNNLRIAGTTNVAILL